MLMNTIVTATAPVTPEHRAAILAPLADYNQRSAPPSKSEDVVITLIDDNGTPSGGLIGRTAHDWLFVEYLSVPEQTRGAGAGRKLLKEAETLAISRGCIGAWLDTFSWQARGFYEKCGYSVFGALENHPVGHSRFFLRKLFSEQQPAV